MPGDQGLKADICRTSQAAQGGEFSSLSLYLPLFEPSSLSLSGLYKEKKKWKLQAWFYITNFKKFILQNGGSTFIFPISYIM